MKEMSNLKPIRDLDSLLNQPDCKAITLSVSDNHANILLWTDVVRPKTDSYGDHLEVIDEIRSLLKITVVPGYRDHLCVKKRITDLEELNKTTKEIKRQDCQPIFQFLSRLSFRLTSESGAEYSYFRATEKEWWQDPFGLLCAGFSFYGSTPRGCGVQLQVELISPASDRQVSRSLPSPSVVLIEETPKVYQTVVEPFIHSVVESGSLSWIKNVVNGTKESERLLYNCDEFIINIDTKWRTHPDAMTVPRDSWFKHVSVEDLYCLAIVKDGSIRSLRDLNAKHISMLQSIVSEGQRVIENIYGVLKDQLRIFVHYHPQFYHFHVHYTRLHNEIGCQVERGHLVTDIIQNLQLASDYYAKRTITYKVQTTNELYFLINEKSKIK